MYATLQGKMHGMCVPSANKCLLSPRPEADELRSNRWVTGFSGKTLCQEMRGLAGWINQP